MATTKKNKGGRAEKKQRSSNTKIMQGTRYECGDCGFVVTVDDICGCTTYHELLCCGEPMNVRECC
jgi:hypothetical protein